MTEPYFLNSLCSVAKFRSIHLTMTICGIEELAHIVFMDLGIKS